MTEKQTLEYENVEDWKDWHAQVAEDMSVIVPKGETADVTIVVETENKEETE